jgi:hypothetical protein
MGIPVKEDRIFVSKRSLQGTYRYILIGLLAFAASAVFLRFLTQYRSSQERGRLIVALLNEQEAQLKGLTFKQDYLAGRNVWADDEPALKSWLVMQAVQGETPEQLAKDLKKISQGKYYSSTLKTSLTRWNSVLARWGRWRAKPQSAADEKGDSDSLMEEGRRRYFEARGFQKIGKSYDSVPLYLWAMESLSRYIRENPQADEVPEALFLLGSTYIRFRQNFPSKVRGDRILNLCAEFFPGSVWAKKSNTLWQEEMRDEV